MSVIRKERPSGNIRMLQTQGRPAGNPPPRHGWPTLLLVGVAVVVCYQIVSSTLFWAGIKLNDLRYGYPRTMQVEGFVGFGESHGQATHVSAMNLHRQVVVIVMPGEDPTRVQVLKGPFLVGPNEEYAPVVVRLIDVTGDRYPDLVVDVDQQHLVWVNEPSRRLFRAATASETAVANRVLSSVR